MGMGLIVMNQAYEKDYLYIISRRGHKRKFHSTGSRYLAKSLIANCKAEKQMFSYLNFRGSRFARAKFLDTEFKPRSLIRIYLVGRILKEVII